MPRSHAVVVLLALVAAPAAHADPFDLYINPVLAKMVDSPNVQEVKQLTSDQVADNDRVLPGLNTAFLIVKTNEGRYARLLVQVARQKVADDKFLPMLLVERYVTYKEGEEQTRLAEVATSPCSPVFASAWTAARSFPRKSAATSASSSATRPIWNLWARLVCSLSPRRSPTSLRRQVRNWWWVRPSKLAISTAPTSCTTMAGALASWC